MVAGAKLAIYLRRCGVALGCVGLRVAPPNCPEDDGLLGSDWAAPRSTAPSQLPPGQLGLLVPID